MPQFFRDQRWKLAGRAVAFDDESSFDHIHTLTSHQQSSTTALWLLACLRLLFLDGILDASDVLRSCRANQLFIFPCSTYSANFALIRRLLLSVVFLMASIVDRIKLYNIYTSIKYKQIVILLIYVNINKCEDKRNRLRFLIASVSTE